MVCNGVVGQSYALHPLLLVVVLLLGRHGHGQRFRFLFLDVLSLILDGFLHGGEGTFSRVLSSLGVA